MDSNEARKIQLGWIGLNTSFRPSDACTRGMGRICPFFFRRAIQPNPRRGVSGLKLFCVCPTQGFRPNAITGFSNAPMMKSNEWPNDHALGSPDGVLSRGSLSAFKKDATPKLIN